MAIMPPSKLKQALPTRCLGLAPLSRRRGMGRPERAGKRLGIAVGALPVLSPSGTDVGALRQRVAGIQQVAGMSKLTYIHSHPRT